MNIDSVALKARSRKTIQLSKPNVISVCAVYLVLSVIIGLLSSKMMYGNFTITDMQTYAQYVASGDYDSAMDIIVDSSPTAPATLLDSVLSFLLSVVAAGFAIFLLNTIRHQQPCYGNLLDGFGIILRIFVLYLLEGIFIALWSILFVIPGIIAAYRYSQALYLLIDHPELSPIECIRQSKAMMVGHKGEFFMLQLSFLGWGILCAIPYVGYAVQFWVTPYYRMTTALYYENLCGRLEQVYSADSEYTN